MVTFPPCKINLGLKIIAKREDGFHAIETCFYTVPWTDILEIIPSQTISFTNTGIPVPGSIEENLCMRAYHLLSKDFKLPPVAIHLHKIVPMGAGLGAGSSDAASTLEILNTLFSLQLSNEKLAGYASLLGSDCPYFIYKRPMVGTGRGEILNPVHVSLTEKFLVLVKPPVQIATGEAYSRVKPSPAEIAIKEIVENSPIENWKTNLVNDFEVPLFKTNPVLLEIKEKLYAAGAIYSSMSGSGSTVYGIFNSSVDVHGEFPGMTYWSGKL